MVGTKLFFLFVRTIDFVDAFFGFIANVVSALFSAMACFFSGAFDVAFGASGFLYSVCAFLSRAFSFIGARFDFLTGGLVSKGKNGREGERDCCQSEGNQDLLCLL